MVARERSCRWYLVSAEALPFLLLALDERVYGTTPVPASRHILPHRSMHDQFNTAWGAEFRTLGPVASIRLKKKKIPGVPAGAAGCRIQDRGTCGYQWWKTANFSHSVHTAHCAPPWSTGPHPSLTPGLALQRERHQHCWVQKMCGDHRMNKTICTCGLSYSSLICQHGFDISVTV